MLTLHHHVDCADTAGVNFFELLFANDSLGELEIRMKFSSFKCTSQFTIAILFLDQEILKLYHQFEELFINDEISNNWVQKS